MSMDLFVKSGKTWKTTRKLTANDWNLCYGDELGAVSLIQIYDNPASLGVVIGDAIISGDFAGVVSGITATGREIQISCGGAEEWFNRDVRYTPSGETLEDQIADMILHEFVNQTDPAYALPFLYVYAEPETAGVSLSDLMVMDGVGVYNAKNAIYEAWLQYRIKCDVEIKNDAVYIAVRKHNDTRHNVILSDGKHQLITRTYGGSIVEKVTVYALDKENTLYASQDYYYLTTGEIATEPGETRLSGSWEVAEITYDPEKADQPDLSDLMYLEAAKLMADNVKDHMIEMRSTVDYGFGDLLTVKFPDGEVLPTRVTAKYKTKGDNRTLYRMGTLPVTLSQKIRKGVLK